MSYFEVLFNYFLDTFKEFFSFTGQIVDWLFKPLDVLEYVGIEFSPIGIFSVSVILAFLTYIIIKEIIN